MFEPGVAATLECVEGVLAGELEARVQDEAIATHDPLVPRRARGDRLVAAEPRAARSDPRLRPRSGSTHALERRHCPPVSARATPGIGGKLSRAPCWLVGEDGIEVATGDGSLRFAKVAAGGKKAPAADAAPGAGIEPGTRFHATPSS